MIRYLTHPLSSISDALASYDAAWRGSEAYAARPEPRYSEEAEGTVEEEEEGGSRRPLDLKYHLIKLYADRKDISVSIDV